MPRRPGAGRAGRRVSPLLDRVVLPAYYFTGIQVPSSPTPLRE